MESHGPDRKVKIRLKDKTQKILSVSINNIKEKAPPPKLIEQYTMQNIDYKKSLLISKSFILTKHIRNNMAKLIKKKEKIFDQNFKLSKHLSAVLKSLKIINGNLIYSYIFPIESGFKLQLSPRLDFNSDIEWNCSVNNISSYKFIPNRCKKLME